MKFTYEYRTSDNARHTGVVVASDREAAFQQLKSQGIKPGRLTEAPGFFNKLFGKGKRWITIVVLGVLCLIFGILYSTNYPLSSINYPLFEDRAQIFGDPAVVQKISHNGWRDAFPDEGESFLARHAIPGKVCDCAVGSRVSRDRIAASLLARKDAPVAILDTDVEELKKMKRMVNGMKREFAAYVAPDPAQPDAPSIEQQARTYMDKACERVRIEKGIFDNIASDLNVLERKLEKPDADRAAILATWDKKNATLRSLGLATIPQPEE